MEITPIYSDEIWSSKESQKIKKVNYTNQG